MSNLGVCIYLLMSWVCLCASSPLGWYRIPRAKTRCQCYTSPSETEWMRTTPPTGCSTMFWRLHHFRHAQIWSRRWPQRKCRPNCPGHGQTAPQVVWRSWCDEPVYHQCHLHRTERESQQMKGVFLWTFEYCVVFYGFNWYSALTGVQTIYNCTKSLNAATFLLPTTYADATEETQMEGWFIWMVHTVVNKTANEGIFSNNSCCEATLSHPAWREGQRNSWKNNDTLSNLQTIHTSRRHKASY